MQRTKSWPAPRPLERNRRGDLFFSSQQYSVLILQYFFPAAGNSSPSLDSVPPPLPASFSLNIDIQPQRCKNEDTFNDLLFNDFDFDKNSCGFNLEFTDEIDEIPFDDLEDLFKA